MYIDALPVVTTGPFTNNIFPISSDQAPSFWVGGGNNAASLLDGHVLALASWNRTLTPTEITIVQTQLKTWGGF